MRVSPRTLLVVTVAALVVLALAFPDPALAAPGGIIKQAARTTWGKVLLFGLVILFLPLILWYMAQRAILVRRTRKVLQRLGREVPHFAWLPLKERIGEVFGWVHSAWDQGKMELARDYMTEWYVRNQQLQLDRWEREGRKNVTSDVKIKAITPLYVSHGSHPSEPDRIVVQIEAQMRDYLVEKATGRVVEGDKTLGDSTTIWSFVHEHGRWLLTNIESDAAELEYLKECARAHAQQEKRVA